jgi:hypothetical protein
MSAPPPVTPTDLGTWLDQDIEANDARAVALIAAAWGMVCDAAGQTFTDDQGNLVNPVPSKAVTYTKVAASRGWLNPAGAQRQAKTLGPKTSDTSWPAYGVSLTDDEKAELAALPGGPTAGITGLGSVTLRAPRGTSPSHGPRFNDWDECW